VSGFTDDASAWQALSGRLAQQQQVNQQMAEYARWGQYYVANQRQIQEALARGQGQPTPVPTPGSPGSVGGAAQQEDWWKAPAWNPENEKYISFDPATGAPVVPIGMDPSIAKQYLDYKTWQRETVEKFFRDPIGTLKPGLEQLIRSEAQKIAGQQVAGYGDQQFAQNYVASQPWMFAKDQAGNVQTDYLGQPLLTPAGSKFKHYLEYAQRSGIQDIRAQQQWAYGMVERDALAWQLQQYQAGQQPGGQPGGPAPAAGQPGAQLTPQQIQQQQQQAALNLGGARHIPGSGAQGNNPAPTPGNGGVPRKPIGRNALVNRLQGALQEKGITQLN
jgi:hypothetical protein